MAMISLIAALGEDHVIGNQNRLPWHLPADLKHFKTVTLGKPVVMGRKTFESIGRPLPGRLNIVVTRDPGFTAPGCTVAQSIDAALSIAWEHPEVMIIGGAKFYAQMLPHAQRMYLTWVRGGPFEGDAYFPRWNSEEWVETAREDHSPDAANPHPYSFVTLERRVPR